MAANGQGNPGRACGGVYDLIWSLICEGKHAQLENQEGRYSLDWSVAVECYFEYVSLKNVSKKARPVQFHRKTVSNKLRAALLNHYRSDGAEEFMEARKLGVNGEIIKRHFQMPLRIFRDLMERPESHHLQQSHAGTVSKELVVNKLNCRNETASPRDGTAVGMWDNPYCSSGNVKWQEDNLLEDSDITPHANMEVEHITSSNISDTFEGDPGSHVTAAETESSDHGIGEPMFTDSGAGVTSGDSAAETAELGSTVTACLLPERMKASPSVVTEYYDSGFLCTSEDSDSTINPRGTQRGEAAVGAPAQKNLVHAVFPKKDFVQGGQGFTISLAEPCSSRIRSGTAYFGENMVRVQKQNAFSFEGKVPQAPNLQPGPVKLLVYADDGQYLGELEFLYVDPEKEVFKMLLKHPNKLRPFLSDLSECAKERDIQEGGNQNSSSALEEQGCGSETLPSNWHNMTSEVEILRLMVYTAAETDAHQFIRVLFSTSVGRAVFSHYRNDTPLPEDVARDNSNLELAEYLEEVHQRLSNEINEDKKMEEIDLQELIDAVQSSWDEAGDSDHDSDYMADEEISSSSSDERLSEVDELIEMESSFRDDSNPHIHSAEEEQMGLEDQKHQQFVAKDEHKFMTNEMNKEEEDFSTQSRDPVQEKEKNQRADDEATKCSDNLREGSVPMAPIKKMQQLTAPTGVRSTVLKADHRKDIAGSSKMATCRAISVLQTTPEKRNFKCLTRLLIVGGTSILREVCDSIHPPSSLPSVLSQPTVQTKLKGSNPSPTGFYGKSSDFDITLLSRLLRSIFGLSSPSSGDWDKLPAPNEKTVSDALTRVKVYFNTIYGHSSEAMEVNDDKFNYLWEEISGALTRLASSVSAQKGKEWERAIAKLINDPLTPENEENVEELKAWYRSNYEVKKMLEILHTQLEQVCESISEDSNPHIHSAEEEQMGLEDQKHQQFVAKVEHMTKEKNKEDEDSSARPGKLVREKEENQRADDEGTECSENVGEGSIPVGTLEKGLAPIKNMQHFTAPTGVKSTALKPDHRKDITDWDDATNQPHKTGGCVKKVLTSTATEEHSEADETQSTTQDTGQGVKADVLALPQSCPHVNAQTDVREQHPETCETQSMTQDTGQGDKAVLTLPQSYQRVNTQIDEGEQHPEACETQSMTQDTGQGEKAVLTLPQSYQRVNAKNDVMEQHSEAGETQSTTPDTGQGDKRLLTLIERLIDAPIQYLETSKTQSTTPDLATKGSVTQREATPKHIEVSPQKRWVQPQITLVWRASIKEFVAGFSSIQSSASAQIDAIDTLRRPVLKSPLLIVAALADLEYPNETSGPWNFDHFYESRWCRILKEHTERLELMCNYGYTRKHQELMRFHEKMLKDPRTHHQSAYFLRTGALIHEALARDKEPIIVVNIRTSPPVITCPTFTVKFGEPCLCRFGFCGLRGVVSTCPTTAVKGGEPCLCRFGFCGPRGVLNTRPTTAVEGEKNHDV